jgi:small subunit ribosomal protein S6
MRIRRYETVFMVPADLDEGKLQDILNRLDAVLERSSGVLVRREDWGVRKLAYEIDRHTKGRYFLMDFVGEPKIILELERNIKMMESILRFLTVKKADEVDMEGIRQEQAEEKEKEEARKASALQRAEEAEKKAQEEAAKKKAEAAEKEAAASEEAATLEEVPAPEEDEEAKKEAAAPEAADGAEEQAPEAEKEPEADTPEPEEAPGNEPEKT